VFDTKALGKDSVDNDSCNLIHYSNRFLTNYIITVEIRKCNWNKVRKEQ